MSGAPYPTKTCPATEKGCWACNGDFCFRQFAAPQEGAGSQAGPAANGEPAVAAILSTIPTREDGVTCHIEDVRKALAAFYRHTDILHPGGQTWIKN